jgi:hypothetical protein
MHVFMVMLLVLVQWFIETLLVILFQKLILFTISLLRLLKENFILLRNFFDDIFNSILFVYWIFRFWRHVLLVFPGICPDFFLCLVVFRVSGFGPFVVFCYFLVNILTLSKKKKSWTSTISLFVFTKKKCLVFNDWHV